MDEERPSDAEMDLAIFPRRTPFWNIISLLSPAIVGVPAFFIFMHSVHDSGWGWGGIGAIILTVCLSSLVGLAAGVTAACRRERLSGLTILALLINGLPILWFLFGILTASTGRR